MRNFVGKWPPSNLRQKPGLRQKHPRDGPNEERVSARLLLHDPASAGAGKSVLGAPQALGTLIASDSIDYEVHPPVVDPQFVWYETQVKVLNFLSGIPPERQYRIRGELILAEPEKQLEKICGWLGIAWSQEIYAAMCKTEDGVLCEYGPLWLHVGQQSRLQKVARIPAVQGEIKHARRPIAMAQRPAAVPSRGGRAGP